MVSQIFHMIYASESPEKITEPEVDSILAVSRINNPKHQITGLLLTRERYFLQLLEGPQAAVLELFQRISRDKRHSQVRLLAESRSQLRMFPKWSMGAIAPDAAVTTMDDIWPLVTGTGAVIQQDKDAMMGIFRSFNKR